MPDRPSFSRKSRSRLTPEERAELIARMTGQTPEAGRDQDQVDRPESGPENGPENRPENRPQDGPENGPQNSPKNRPENAPAETAETTPERGPKRGPEPAPDPAPEIPVIDLSAPTRPVRRVKIAPARQQPAPASPAPQGQETAAPPPAAAPADTQDPDALFDTDSALFDDRDTEPEAPTPPRTEDAPPHIPAPVDASERADAPEDLQEEPPTDNRANTPTPAPAAEETPEETPEEVQVETASADPAPSDPVPAEPTPLKEAALQEAQMEAPPTEPPVAQPAPVADTEPAPKPTPGPAPEPAPAPAPHDAATPEEVWASLPSFPVDPRHLERNLIITAGRHDPAHGAFDVLRTRLVQTLADNGWKRVAVTSPTRDCGKTFTAVNLAISLSRYEAMRTVLMDMDMRNPSVAGVIGVGDPGSMGDFLQGTVPPAQHFRRLGRNALNIGSNLAVGLNDRVEPYASELMSDPLADAALARMMDDLAPDVVLYDMPPALAFDDVIAFRRHFDGILMVIGGGKTRADEVHEVMRRLGEDVPLLGVVLNQSEGESRAGYTYGY